MNFASDNTGPAHPKVMEAIVAANDGYQMPYGADTHMDRVRDQVREVFEAPEAAVYLVATGTAANSILLATLAEPWETIFCATTAHIHEDECGCPELFTGGAKLTLVSGDNGKMSADVLKGAIEAEETRGVHGPQRGPVSLTQATEKGTVYSLAEIKEITGIAKSFGLATHMDGARFTNALVTLGCSAAEMTWKAGIDAVSFGGTKNGLLGVEAAIIFDPEKAWEFELRRKRSAHLFSKHRFLSAQMTAYLTDDLWLDMARAANAACAKLTRGLKQIEGTAFHFEPEANIIFADWSRAGHKKLHDAGAAYYLWSGALEGDDPSENLTARLVTDWSASDENIEQFLDLARG
jgi:threonine aldolase